MTQFASCRLLEAWITFARTRFGQFNLEVSVPDVVARLKRRPTLSSWYPLLFGLQLGWKLHERIQKIGLAYLWGWLLRILAFGARLPVREARNHKGPRKYWHSQTEASINFA